MGNEENKEFEEIFNLDKGLEFGKNEYEVNIVPENKQLAIRLPRDVVRLLNIDTKKDKFKFYLDIKNRKLKGELIQDEEK